MRHEPKMTALDLIIIITVGAINVITDVCFVTGDPRPTGIAAAAATATAAAVGKVESTHNDSRLNQSVIPPFARPVDGETEVQEPTQPISERRMALLNVHDNVCAQHVSCDFGEPENILHFDRAFFLARNIDCQAFTLNI